MTHGHEETTTHNKITTFENACRQNGTTSTPSETPRGNHDAQAKRKPQDNDEHTHTGTTSERFGTHGGNHDAPNRNREKGATETPRGNHDAQTNAKNHKISGARTKHAAKTLGKHN